MQDVVDFGTVLSIFEELHVPHRHVNNLPLCVALKYSCKRDTHDMRLTAKYESRGGCVVLTSISVVLSNGEARAIAQNCVSNGNS